jgi:hypothetical protein
VETDTQSLDGHSFHNDIRKMSPEARHVIRQLEVRGWVRVDQISAKDLVDISKWFGKEIGVVQSPVGQLRVILGTENGVLKRQIAPGETFVVHTHPVMVTHKEHFGTDLKNAGDHVEAVIDWSGQITYFTKQDPVRGTGGVLNPTRPDGTVAPMHDYQAAFMDAVGNIVGFARIDVIDGPQGTRIIVRE